MREIIFKGKRKDNDEWPEGSLLYDNEQNETYIAEHFEDRSAYIREVIPETVGQYTGLTDKNGKKIFEGDILVFCKGVTYPIKVHWDGLGWKFLRNDKNIYDAFEINTIDHIKNCEVIGNIHDNPELLKGGDE